MEPPPRSQTPPRGTSRPVPSRPLPLDAVAPQNALSPQFGGPTSSQRGLLVQGANRDDPLGLGISRNSQRQLPPPPQVAADASSALRNSQRQLPVPPQVAAAASPTPQISQRQLPGPPQQLASDVIATPQQAQPAAAPGSQPTARGKRPPPPLSKLTRKPPPILPQTQRAELESRYAAARTAAHGELKVEEVKAFLESEGIDVDDSYVQRCVEQFDVDGNGTLSLDEFHILVMQVVPTMFGQKDGDEGSLDIGTKRPTWNNMRAKAGAFAELSGQRFPLTAETWRSTSPAKQRMVMVGCFCWCLAFLAFLVSVGSVLMAEECIEALPVTSCSDPASLAFSSDVEPAVDIVFVDDRSSSMTAYEDHNTGNYYEFMRALASNSSALGDRWRLIVANSADGCHTNDGAFLSVDTPGAETAFHRAARAWRGALYPHTETLMLVAQRAIEQAYPGGCNEGFLRRDALLHIILISDAQTPYQPMLDALVLAKDNDPSLVQVSVFRSFDYVSMPYNYTAEALNIDLAAFSEFGAIDSTDPGFGYKHLAARTGGIDGSVASNDWRHACYVSNTAGDMTPVLQDCTHGYDVDNALCSVARVGEPACPQVEPTVGTCVHLDEGATPPAPPVPTGGVCSLDLRGRGGDEGYRSGAVDAGKGGFSLDVVFTSYQQRDQLIVCRGACPPQTITDVDAAPECSTTVTTNCVTHNSGCVGVTQQHSYIPFPSQDDVLEIEIQVLPNCQGGRGTAWVLGSVCTPEPPPPPPTPVFSPARPTCDYSSSTYDILSMTADTVTVAVSVDTVIFPNDIVRLKGAPNLSCAAGSDDLVVSSVTAGVITLVASLPADPDPATNCKLVRKVPKCDTGHTAPIVRDGVDFEANPKIETQVCYRDLVEELAVDRKVFGHSPVPTLPGHKNYTNLQLYVGSTRVAGPRVLADGSINSKCTVDGECIWTLKNPAHRAGEAQLEFEMLQEELADLFDDGRQSITLRWEQTKLDGCVTIYPEACPEGHNPLLYALFLILLILICVATYKSVVRKHAVTPPASHMVLVKDYSGEVHEVQITEGMTISDVKSLLEKVSGVPLDELRLFNEEFSQNQLDGPLEVSVCGLIPEQGAPAKTLTMMVSWTLYVREESISETVAAKMQELGLDMAAKIHTVEGVEKHWKIESVKLRLEQMTGIPAQDQRLHVVTSDGTRPLDDGTALPDYFPDIRNRSELCMVDSDPDRSMRGSKEGALEQKKSMGADSVRSMARMFQAGHVPGSSLSDLKEDSLRMKKQAYYASFFGSDRSRSGAKISATSQANLMARAGRAKGMHRP